LRLGIAADEGGSGNLVADKEGTPRIGLGMGEGVPSIVLTGDNGKKIVAMKETRKDTASLSWI
jgi:hypothetical protein